MRTSARRRYSTKTWTGTYEGLSRIKELMDSIDEKTLGQGKVTMGSFEHKGVSYREVTPEEVREMMGNERYGFVGTSKPYTLRIVDKEHLVRRGTIHHVKVEKSLGDSSFGKIELKFFEPRNALLEIGPLGLPLTTQDSIRRLN